MKLQARAARLMVAVLSGAGLTLTAVGSAAVGTAGAAPLAEKSGVITWAEAPGSTPNYIFPLDPSAYFTPGNMAQFQSLMYEPLFEAGMTTPRIDYAESIGDQPVWSDGDRVVTVTLKHYLWSNGAPVTARDVTFCINLLKAVGADWAGYTPAGFPLNVASATIDSPTKFTLTLTEAFNPTYYDEGELFDIIPLPQSVWDRESLHGAVGNYDLTAKGALKVWNFLTSYASNQDTYSDTNQIWGVTDGPYKLASFGRDASPDVFVPNPRYSGHRSTIAKFEELPFTTNSAEYDDLRAGNGAITVGYVPDSDVPTIATVRSAGYRVVPVPQWGIEYFLPNLKNPVLGAAFSQLYVRQALQHLVDQPVMIKQFLHGYGVPTYGPGPVAPKGNPFADSFESHNPYPFSISAARRLLESHGWKIVGGVQTCVDPAKCGPGVKDGTQLKIQLLDPSGVNAFTEEAELFEADAARVGIDIVVKEEPYGTVLGIVNPCTPGVDGVTLSSPLCTWQLANYEGWDYASVFPSGGEFLLPGADGNAGSFVDPTLTAALEAVRHAATLAAYHHYEDVVAKLLPFIWQPTASELVAVSTRLGGTRITGEFDDLSPLTPNYWYLKK
jgi:peptide/nickel transport system substrate-binding protein